MPPSRALLLLLGVLAGLGLLLGGCGTSPDAQDQAVGERPNIVLIMADDLGREGLGAYGGTSYDTPHLDRLAATGLRFDRAYAQPLCTPSRVKIMTGKYNFRNYERFGTLNPEEPTFAHMLRGAGYATAIAGKWQLRGDRETPHRMGFDEYLLWQLQPGDYWHRYKHPILVGHDTPRDTLRGAYGPDRFAAFVERFIGEHRDAPFFVYYPMVLPHRPFQPTPDQAAFADFPVTSLDDTTHFSAMVSYMDQIVGRITDALDAAGVRDNTLLLFTTDNGTDRDITSRLGRRVIQGDKGYSTAAGTHVPLIAHWPGTIPPSTSGSLVNLADLVPTLADAADVPPDQRLDTDGRSFYPTLMGDPQAPRSWMFFDYDPKGRDFPPRRWVQDEQYKLYSDGRFYHYRRDPTEENPLSAGERSAEAAQAHAKLQAALDAMRREIQASE